jgi:uncharacterized cupredoxin-like copper-binding protein
VTAGPLGAAGLLVLAGCGGADPPAASREVRIAATAELRFSPDRVTARPGETVAFVIENTSQVGHEFAIGDAEFQARHGTGGHAGHDAAGGKSVEVGPGKTARLVFTMPQEAPVFACHVDDHDAAGMTGRVAYG